MPDEPVPITPTRWLVKSTVSCGHLPLWYHLPLKLSKPGKSGTLGSDSWPLAITQNRAVISSP